MAFDRVSVLRHGIEPGHTAAIEIGPLDKPVLCKPDFCVRYLDFETTEFLSKKYADDPNVGAVVDVDIIWDGSTPLADVLRHEKVDAVVASHVFEHVPDPVGWLKNFASVLHPGGTVTLAIPDMRYTFDINRRLSEVSDLVDAYLRKATVPSYAQMYDFHVKAVPVDAVLLWAGRADYTGRTKEGDLHREAFDGCVARSRGGPYTDVHCHTFTPASFVDLLEQLSDFGLVDFAIAELVPTQVNTVEFIVRLERLDPNLRSGQRLSRQRQGFHDARRAIAAGPVPGRPEPDPAPESRPEPEPEPERLLLSEREERLIRAKRRVMTSARSLLHAGRTRSAAPESPTLPA